MLTKDSIKLDIPFVPSSNEKVKVMLKLAGCCDGKKMADLGSGDGKVVIAFAKAGAKPAHGYEKDDYRAIFGQANIEDEGLQSNAQIFHKSFWKVDLSEYDIITLFGITSIMKRLERKLQKELKSGAKVISNMFVFPDWEPATVENNVYLYIKD